MGPDVLEGVDAERIAAVCRRYGIAASFVFGSFARGEATDTSDVDVLYELRPGVRLGWEIEDLADELEQIFGRPVDLIARSGVHPRLAATVLGEARPIYAA
jgi:predicted nucleotidyltransferase